MHILSYIQIQTGYPSQRVADRLETLLNPEMLKPQVGLQLWE
jgi:hypothetical protein